jgi:hypothetical protein
MIAEHFSIEDLPGKDGVLRFQFEMHPVTNGVAAAKGDLVPLYLQLLVSPDPKVERPFNPKEIKRLYEVFLGQDIQLKERS